MVNPDPLCRKNIRSYVLEFVGVKICGSPDPALCVYPSGTVIFRLQQLLTNRHGVHKLSIVADIVKGIAFVNDLPIRRGTLADQCAILGRCVKLIPQGGKAQNLIIAKDVRPRITHIIGPENTGIGPGVQLSLGFDECPYGNLAEVGFGWTPSISPIGRNQYASLQSANDQFIFFHFDPVDVQASELARSQGLPIVLTIDAPKNSVIIRGDVKFMVRLDNSTEGSLRWDARGKGRPGFLPLPMDNSTELFCGQG